MNRITALAALAALGLGTLTALPARAQDPATVDVVDTQATAQTRSLLKLIPEHVWAPALDAHDQIRDGAWVAEFTGLMDLRSWPAGMRVIVRKERPQPGAQLRFEDVDRMRITAFASFRTSSCVTGAGPAARTASGSRRTPA